MFLKLEFVYPAGQQEANMSALCHRFNISRPTGYKWLKRYREECREGLSEQDAGSHRRGHLRGAQRAPSRGGWHKIRTRLR